MALVGRWNGRLALGRVQAWTPKQRWLCRDASFEERREVEDEVLGEVAEVCKRYGARCVTDQYAAPQVVARLRQFGLSVQQVTMTSTTKTAAFQELRARLNMGELELYRDEQLLKELGRLRTRYTAGTSTVVNPRVGGSHGDLAQALALACYSMRGAGSAFQIEEASFVVEIQSWWERVEGLHFGPATSWLELAVDGHGNLITVQELVESGLPSKAAPTILAARGKRKHKRDTWRCCYAGPTELLGPVVREWGRPSTVRDEFGLLNLHLLEANENRSAGFVRIMELLHPDPAHAFPQWHERAGEHGSPRLFLNNCPTLVEQLSSAPFEEEDEQFPRAAVSQRWEANNGGLVAALRYAALSRPLPAKEPEEWEPDMRKRTIQRLLREQDNPSRRDREWA